MVPRPARPLATPFSSAAAVKGPGPSIVFPSSSGAQLLLFDADLSPSQAAKLEDLADRPVLDRSGLILEIFRSRARSREARTQVELAQLEYQLPRLTRRWGHLSRQVGGIGVRGVVQGRRYEQAGIAGVARQLPINRTGVAFG